VNVKVNAIYFHIFRNEKNASSTRVFAISRSSILRLFYGFFFGPFFFRSFFLRPMKM
jgi:hypothetical protein